MPDRLRAPGFLGSGARRFRESGAEPVAPRDAATVILLRGVPDGSDGFEVFTQKRAATMAFAAGMYVFPGGTVDPRDAHASVGWVGPQPEVWATRLGRSVDEARAVVCAAVREVFEECGVLLAGPDESTVVGDVAGDEWEAARLALLNREVGLAALLEDKGLLVRSDLLAPWARWLTPEFEPRRYDTFFFLARLPAEQRTRDVGGESVHAVWAPPAQLAGLEMLPPTAYTLRQLASYETVDALLAASGGRDLTKPVRPYIEFDNEGPWLVLGS
jgi:8-oxo-dGTP pyrophosphatase MutT (NUDIX family)